jgi:hypothetical protein
VLGFTPTLRQSGVAIDSFSSKATFARVEFQIHFPEFAEHCIQMLKVLPPVFIMHIEVVNEHFQKSASQVLKDL